jgi:hypothetical protein
MATNAIEQLRDAGAPVDLLSADQRAVIDGLTPEEAAVIVSVSQRIADTGSPEVEGQTVVGAGVF